MKGEIVAEPLLELCPHCGAHFTPHRTMEAIRKQERQRIQEALKPAAGKLRRIRDLDEQTSDGALGSLARRALDDLAGLDTLDPSE